MTNAPLTVDPVAATRHAPPGPQPEPAADDLPARFAAQRDAFARAMNPSLAERLDRLDRLLAMTERLAAPMADAISADFGHRPRQVTMLADTMVVRAALRHARRRLKGWTAVRRVPTALAYRPGWSRVQAQPLGVVGIVSPWNYPYQLAMSPAASALAAGNRAMVKPSELTPRFAALLADAVAQAFDPGEMTVVEGGVETAKAFVALPFDHLLFTGSTAVGREVARAAASNLTPVTLELGGKSPAIFHADCDLARAVPRLVMGKLFNAGQTCIAPDYVLLPPSLLTEFTERMRAETARFFPTIAANPDYTSLVDARHVARLEALLDDARTQGARVLPLHAETLTVGRKMPPALVLDVNERMQIMREEIFGPLLPVVVYDAPADAIAHVNRQPRPLALYWFGRDRAALARVLRETVSGGVTVNDCLWHVAQEGLPFGGVGESGHGRYHGEHGFRTFSHDKPVFHQPAHSGLGMMAPPYGRGFERLLRMVRLIS